MFSWSQPGKKASQYPGRRTGSNVHAPVEGSIRPPVKDYTRAQHLESYVDDPTLKRSTRRVSTDDTTYDTVFQTTSGDNLIIRVNVPLQSSFAAFCPAMKLAGVQVKHPWVDPRSMRLTGYAPIQSQAQWSQSGLTLGEAVHAVVQHLQLHPPEILEITDAGLQAVQPPNSKHRTAGARSKSMGQSTSTSNGNGTATSNSHTARPASSPPSYDDTLNQQSHMPNLPPPPPVHLPRIPRDFSDVLKPKTREELEILRDDHLEFLSLLNALPISQELHQVSADQRQKNVKLAKANLEQEDTLKSLRTEVERLQKVFQEKVDKFQELEAEQDRLCAPPDLSRTLKELHKAKKEAWDASEEFAEDWVDNGDATNVDAFVKEFLQQRKVHHQRAAKMEVLQYHQKQRVSV